MFLHSLATAIVFVLAISPTLVLNTIQFHWPFKTGYDFWIVNQRPNHAPFFSPRYIPNNAALLWNEFALRPQRFSIANFLGTGTIFVPAFVVLFCVGAFFVLLDRFVICAFLAGLSFFAFTTSYYERWVDIRLYLPLLFLLGCRCRFTCHMGGRKSYCGKRGHCLRGKFCFVCRSLSGLPFPLRLQHRRNQSITGMGCAPFPWERAVPIPRVVYRSKASC